MRHFLYYFTYILLFPHLLFYLYIISEAYILFTPEQCVLHNYLQKSTGNSTPADVQDERDGLQEYQALQNFTNMGCRASSYAYVVRDKFKLYFCMGDGEVPWQYTTVQRGLNRSV